MTSTRSKSETRHSASLAEARAPDGGFKRLALPAVAAAVQPLAQTKSRKSGHREGSALLRREDDPS